jgi:hypothetical protein
MQPQAWIGPGWGLLHLSSRQTPMEVFIHGTVGDFSHHSRRPNLSSSSLFMNMQYSTILVALFALHLATKVVAQAELPTCAVSTVSVYSDRRHKVHVAVCNPHCRLHGRLDTRHKESTTPDPNMHIPPSTTPIFDLRHSQKHHLTTPRQHVSPQPFPTSQYVPLPTQPASAPQYPLTLPFKRA